MGAYKWWILSFSFSLAFSTFCFFSSKCDCAKYVPNFYKFPVRKLVSILTKNVLCHSLKEPLKVKGVPVVFRTDFKNLRLLNSRSYTNKLPELKTMDRASWFFSTKLVILLAILFFSWFFDYNKTIWLLLFEKYSSRIRKIDIWSQKCGQWTNE